MIAVRIQSMLPINVPLCSSNPIDLPPCLSNNNPGKEGLPLEAAEDSTPQVDDSMAKSVMVMSNAGLHVQFRQSSMRQIDPNTSKKKARVLTSASECFCNMPSYGFMVSRIHAFELEQKLRPSKHVSTSLPFYQVHCKSCEAHFHAACIRIEGMKPG